MASVILDRAAMAVIAVVAIAIAGAMLAAYLADPDLLWRAFYHDRNSHFAFGLDLALSARNGDPLWFFSELDKAKVWPPLHGLVLAAVLLIAGPDHRFAIVPSLIGWSAMVIFSAFTARALFKDAASGVLAAVVTATFAVASPALHLLASDVMLEGLGAGLSALAIFCYGRARAEPNERWRWRLLALTLTALFFEKGNYWGLVVVALAAEFLSEDIGRWHARARDALRRARDAWPNLARDPLLIAAAAILAAVLYLYWRGPTAITIFDRAVSLYPPENLTTLAYALVLIRILRALARHRAELSAQFGTAGRALLIWHLAPVAIWFLLPRRLSAFLWFVGPANHDWRQSYDPAGGLALYGDAFVNGFHVAPWAAAVAVALALVAALRFARLPPAGRAALMLVLVAAIAVVLHPQHQPRFLASWMFAVWIAAGAGAGILFEEIAARRLRAAAIAIASAAALALIAGTGRQSPSPRLAFYASQTPVGANDLDLVRPYLAELNGTRSVLFATTFGMSKLFHWMLREHCRCRIAIEEPWIEGMHSRAEARDLMAQRVAHSSADAVVIIDAPQSPYSHPPFGWVYGTMAGIPDAMTGQNNYIASGTYPLPGQGGQATLWRRAKKPAAAGE